MKKPLYSTVYVLCLLSAGLTIHQAFAQRSPAIEPMTEVSIEENQPAQNAGKPANGFDFDNHKVVTTEAHDTTRVPANIATKSSESSTPYSFIGPMIFLLALPIALWIVISKKMKVADVDKKIDYYPKTFQFKPYKSEYQEQDVDDDDQEFPKAS